MQEEIAVENEEIEMSEAELIEEYEIIEAIEVSCLQ